MRIGIYIHEKIWKKAKEIAQNDCRTVSGLITKLLMAEITRHVVVPDGSITTIKLVNGAATSEKLGYVTNGNYIVCENNTERNTSSTKIKNKRR